MNSILSLEKLHKLVSGAGDKFCRADAISAWSKLGQLAELARTSNDSHRLRNELEDTITRLEAHVPRLVDSVRGCVDVSNTIESNDTIKTDAIAREVFNDSAAKLRTLTAEQQEERSRWFGLPELCAFENMTDVMKCRATRIRDWCEDRLEFIHSRGRMRFYTAHGIRHSKRVLRFGTELLRAFPHRMSDPFSFFVMYTAAYCHDLGMMLREEEDPECEITFEKVRKAHGRRTWEILMGNQQHRLHPMWRAMGFTSEREALVVANTCALHQKSVESKIPGIPLSQSLFHDGGMISVPSRALALLLRLADALDCDETRLPPFPYLQHGGISEKSQREYIKHELVEDVVVGADGTINVAMRVRYQYPSFISAVEIVCSEIANEIRSVSVLLEDTGVKIPEPQFNTIEALFLEPHPYIVSE